MWGQIFRWDVQMYSVWLPPKKELFLIPIFYFLLIHSIYQSLAQKGHEINAVAIFFNSAIYYLFKICIEQLCILKYLMAVCVLETQQWKWPYKMALQNISINLISQGPSRIIKYI